MEGAMEWIPISDNAKVQPGWIYLRKDGTFCPPKQKLKQKIEESPCSFRVEEITSDRLKSFQGKGIMNKSWEDDLTYLRDSQTYKLIYSFISKERYIKDHSEYDLNFERVSRVMNVYGIMIMVKYAKNNCDFLFEDIFHILHSKWNGCSVNTKKHLSVQGKINSVKIYYGNVFQKKDAFIVSANSALKEIVDVLKSIRREDHFESIEAYVNKLPDSADNHSESMCNPTRKEPQEQSYFRKIIDPILRLLPRIHDNKVNCHSIKEGNQVREIVQSLESKETMQSTYRFDYGNPYNVTNAVAMKCSSDHTSKVITQPYMENKHTQTDAKKLTEPDEYNNMNNVGIQLCLESSVEKRSSSPSHNCPKGNHSTATKVNKTDIGTKTNFQAESEDLNKSLPAKEISSEKPLNSASKNIALMGTPTAAVNLLTKKDVGTKSNKAKPDYSKKTNPPTKKIQLEKPSKMEDRHGFKHLYYDCRVEITREESKTLLLVGSEDHGKLSLLNLVWNLLSTTLELEINYSPIVDISSKINSVTFYHFGSLGSEDNELIIIVTPELNDKTLETLKQSLNEGAFNIHALGFVFGSRAEVLTSEERSFFSYMRSSFGEVSNHHLLALVTHCDFSRNFPVLEEMKKLNIRPNSKKTFEFRNPDMGLTEELVDLQNAVVKRDMKQVKKVLNALKDLSLLSVKSMKMAQEKSYVDSHLIRSKSKFEEELNIFITLANSGDISRVNISKIWTLAKLVTAMESSNTGSENDLIGFVAKSLTEITPKKELTSKYLLLLVLCCPERNISTSLATVLKWHFEIHSTSYVDPMAMKDLPSATTHLNEDGTATFFCNQCKDIHMCERDPMGEKAMFLKCKICTCNGLNSHSLWSFQESFILSQSLCQVALRSLREIYNELSKLSIVIDFNTYLILLSEIFPNYNQFLQDIQKVNSKHAFLY